MNPSFVEEVAPGPRRPSRLAGGLRLAGKTLLFIIRLPFMHVLFGRKPRENVLGAGGPLSRALRAVFYRLLFAPVVVTLIVAVMVYAATHPGFTPSAFDPMTYGVYYDPVSFLSVDGHTQLEGWIIPILEPRTVIQQQQKVLHERFPAIVLVHDYGQSRQQMLPLARPLHDAGYVVLILSLRGNNTALPQSVTFGLNESKDVLAAVHVLRRRPFVDPQWVGAIGIGTGANAVLIARQDDPSIRALVLDHPLRDFDDVMNRYMAPPQRWLGWTAPLCKWGFQMANGVDPDRLSVDTAALHGESTLSFVNAQKACTSAHQLKPVLDFFAQTLRKPSMTASDVEIAPH